MSEPSSASPRGALRIVHGLDAVAERYDLVLCDVWGVIHDGIVAFREAGEALTRFRALPGERPRRVVLLTNAPRPHYAVQKLLDRLGVLRSAYDGIVSSGDLTRRLLADPPGGVVHHIGPERDRPLFDALGLTFAEVEEAGSVVCTGLFDDETETAEDYAPTLARMRARGLAMICANPDLVVSRGERLIPCAGALGVAYEALGGEVVYAGKPHAPIYEMALAEAAGLDGGAPVPRERVLAIGDALRTDIAGAKGVGLSTLMVLQGIHAAEIGGPEPMAAVEGWLAGQTVRPDAVIDSLVWSAPG